MFFCIFSLLPLFLLCIAQSQYFHCCSISSASSSSFPFRNVMHIPSFIVFSFPLTFVSIYLLLCYFVLLFLYHSKPLPSLSFFVSISIILSFVRCISLRVVMSNKYFKRPNNETNMVLLSLSFHYPTFSVTKFNIDKLVPFN